MKQRFVLAVPIIVSIFCAQLILAWLVFCH